MKKMFRTLAVLMLCLSFLVSCGGKKETVSKFDENGRYVPQNEMEITVWQTQGTDYTAKALKDGLVEKWLVDKTKVKVTNIYGNDGGQWDGKLAKLVAGDSMPEIVACGAYQGPAHFAKLNELEMVWELTPELLQKYAPDLWERIPQRYWDAIKVDGKILGIPYDVPRDKQSHPDASDEEFAMMSELYNTPYNDITIAGVQCLYVRDDILKKFFPEAKTYNELVEILEEMKSPIGEELLDIPIYSTEDYIDFMYDIKNANLKENGKKIYPFGYSGGDNWTALAWLGADMYGYKGHYYTGTWNDVKKRIEIPLVGDVVREAARTQNRMIADEVIDPESMAHTSAQAKEKILNGLYAIAPINAVSDLVTVNNSLESQGKKFRYRPFYTQVPALEGYGPFKEDTMWGQSLCILKTVDEEGLHQILNWINTQFTDEYESVRFWGPEEAGLYTTDENGKRSFKDERFKKYYLDNDTSALEPEETKGINGPRSAGYSVGGLFTVGASDYTNRWDPKVHLNYVSYVPTPNSGFKFPSTSEHTKSVKLYPPCQGWSSIYADIPEVVAFWAEREQWENLFKIAMANPPSQFDKKWDEAIAGLNNIANIKTLEDKMTEIAKPIAEILNKGE